MLPSLHIAYARGPVGNSDIYVARADLGEVACLACDPACDEAEPAWSPGGEYLVYQSNCGGSYDLWVVSRHGGAPLPLTSTADLDEREPAWSPDGVLVAYRASPVGENRDSEGVLWAIVADGSQSVSLGVTGRGPAWSPDGYRLAFMSEASGLWQIYVYDLTQRIAVRLTDCAVNCRWPAWSPDGSSLAYNTTTSAASTDPDGIWTAAAGGGEPALVAGGGGLGRPAWSASGWIAFGSPAGIEIALADGTRRRVLVSQTDAWAPAWSQ